MNYAKTIKIDLADKARCETIGESAVSGDSGYRVLTFALEEDGQPWLVPDGVRVRLGFRSDWGDGEYDTMPDGADAAVISGNLVTVRLHDGVLAGAGAVSLWLILQDQKLGRLSSHKMLMTVTEGLIDAAQLPIRYYRLRNLDEIHEVLSDLEERVDAVDTEANRTASREARDAAEEAKQAAASMDTESIERKIAGKGEDLAIDPMSGKLRLLSGFSFVGDGVQLPDGGGVGFEAWSYDQNTKYLHLYDGDGNDVIDPVYIPGGGGGSDSGSRLTVAMKTGTSLVAAKSEDEVWLEFSFASVDTLTQVPTGSGTMEIAVGGVVKRTAPVDQGDVRVNIRPWLSGGANAVRLTVTDSYGAVAVRNMSVSLETLSLSWNLGATERCADTLAVNLTPVGNGTKTIHLQVDGQELEVFEVSTSGRRVSKTIPVQSHGGHIVTAWAEMEIAGTTMCSDALSCAVAWVTEDAPVICCAPVPEEQDQFSTVQLVHRVIDPQSNPANVRYLVNGTLFKEAEVDQSEQVWSYRLSAAQDTTLTILCGNVRQDTLIRVNAIGGDVQEVLDGLKLKVDPSAMADLEPWTEGGCSFTLSEGFDTIHGGLQSDEDGIRCIRVTAGDRLTLNYPLFARDARSSGLAAKLVYAVRNPSAKHCTAISCLQGDVGLEIQANNVYLRGNQTVCRLSTCEDEKVELDLNIQPDSDDGIMFLWERCSTFAYMKYAADESFTHTQATGITIGCDDADVYIYLLRFYDRDLTDTERMANFAADGSEPGEILSRQDRNDIYDSTGSIDIEKCADKNPDCHHIVISADRMTRGKSDEVKGTIRHICRSGGPEHQWTAEVSMFVQGTSSVEHAETAGPNINFYYPKGIVLENGTVMTDGYAMNGRDKSIPVLELTYKKNIASEDHIVNRASAEWYNRYQPSIRTERAENPLIRDCLDSCMCAVYFHNTGAAAVQVGPDLVAPGETIFFGLGNLCSNKDSAVAFGYHPIVIEVKNNTEPQVRFKSKDLTGDNWKNNYEFRYLDTEQFTEEEAKAEWQKVQDFLYDTDCSCATNATLPMGVTIGNWLYTQDTVQYRKAKWEAESEALFDKKTLTWHHNITLFLLLRDNRAKNMFWSYDPVAKKWGLWFNWDNDTGLCRNNDGYVDIEPGYMDFDTLGTGNVFNGADNALFSNLREWEFEQLRSAYLDRESAGAWDIGQLYRYAMDSQEAICEALWVEDAAHNAIRTMQNLGTAAYLERATGRLRLHIKKALTFQKVLVDSYYCSAAATGQSSAFRGYTPSQWAGVAPNGKIAVTTYTNMYINAMAGSTNYRVRATEGIPVELDISASLNNTEIYFRHAPWLQDLGDLSGLYPGQFEASALKRVRRLLIGSENPDYSNTNFTQASFDNCVKLETLNLGGLCNAKRSFDFRPNLYLKELYTKGSGITGLAFAGQGRLESARLNALKSLSVDTLTKLKTFEMPSSVELTTLSVENTPTLDTRSIADGAVGLERVRLVGIDWQCENADTLLRLAGCAGRDDEGREIPEPVVTGRAYIEVITEAELARLGTAFPELQLSYGSIVEGYTVRFTADDGTPMKLLDGSDAVFQVRAGEYVTNPITAGLMAEPVKSSDVEYDYKFLGWSTPLGPIRADTDITAAYVASDRFYTVRFWHEQAEISLMEEHRIIAHGSCRYGGADPEMKGAMWMGWDQSTVDVTEDLNVHAVYVVPRLPDSVPEGFDYLYSDDPSDNCAYSLEEFAGVVQLGQARTYFQIGDKIRMKVLSQVFADREIILKVCGFDHYRLADGSAFAGVVFGMEGLMNASIRWNNTSDNQGGWEASDIRSFLSDSVYPELGQHWRSLIRTVQVRASEGGNSGEIVTSLDELFLFSAVDVGCSSDVYPYSAEVDPEAAQQTLEAFPDNASRIRKTFNGTGTAQSWWLRSPDASNVSNAYAIRNTGSLLTGHFVGYSYWICFGFCM